MPLSFITGNSNKFAEVQAILGDVQQLKIDLPEIQEIDPQAIIAAKLQAAFDHHPGPFMVEDTSLTFDCLGGKLPGPLIKWFVEELQEDGIRQLIQPYANKSATARCIVGYATSPDDIHYFVGEVSGTIIKPRVPSKFGRDPLFQPEGYDLTYAEMSKEEKNKISHRRLAVEKLREFLK